MKDEVHWWLSYAATIVATAAIFVPPLAMPTYPALSLVAILALLTAMMVHAKASRVKPSGAHASDEALYADFLRLFPDHVVHGFLDSTVLDRYNERWSEPCHDLHRAWNTPTIFFIDAEIEKARRQLMLAIGVFCRAEGLLTASLPGGTRTTKLLAPYSEENERRSKEDREKLEDAARRVVAPYDAFAKLCRERLPGVARTSPIAS